LGARARLETSLGAAERSLARCLLIQIVAASVALWALQDHLEAVLFVLVAAQLPALRDGRVVLAGLVLANVSMFAWLFKTQPPGKAAQVGLAYVAFELFAAFVSRAAYRAQQARREALRVNGELRAARALVAEGARVSERLRLSRELHDIAGHKLTALKLHLALEVRQRGKLEGGTLKQCAELADDLLSDIRMVVSALRKEDAIDLQTAIMALDLAPEGVRVSYAFDSEALVSDIGKAEALLRCAQEGLTNALRHGEATEVRVSLQRQGDDLVLRVEDNGGGYATSAAPAEGNGLRGLRERLEEFHGRVALGPRQPCGCVLQAVMPQPRLAC
jgi:signal transduction histidine kinase